MLDTHRMLVVALSVVDKANRVRFFKKTFLVANISLKVVLGMFFLTLSGADIDFSAWELWWRTYTTKEAFLTIKHVELVGKKEFAATVLDQKYETYIVHVTSLSSALLIAFFGSTLFNVYPLQRPQISGLIAEEASIKIPNKYADIADVFSPDLVFALPKHTGINDYTIKLIDGKQPSYRPIYSQKLIELETLKAYIEINLANGLIKPSKSPAGAPILFDQMSDGFF